MITITIILVNLYIIVCYLNKVIVSDKESK